MATKATWLWNGATKGNTLSFGFSETWYTTDAPDAAITKMRALAIIRAQSLGAGIGLYGYRVQLAGSRSLTVRENSNIAAPAQNSTVNVPMDAALCRCIGSAASAPVKRFFLHALPDDDVQDTQFVNPNAVAMAAANWINALQTNGFMFQYQVLSAASRVNSIAADGTVVLADNLVVVAGSNVILRRVRDTNGRGVTGIYRVAPDPAPTQLTFKLLGWRGQTVAVSGRVSTVDYLTTGMLPADPIPGRRASATIRPGVRKVGRPFGLFRGRVPVRR